jgi:predicted AlkP superfamily phosphohydrolase/phosphomutase
MQCQRAVYDYYDFTDELIGHLLTRFNENDLVLVVSDHGFESGFEEGRTGNHVSPFASFGVLLASGPRVVKNAKVAGTRVVDITPTVLDWYGLPVAQDMDGKPASFLEPLESPPIPVKTYDDIKIERLGSGSSAGEAAVKEQLKSLGYLH